MLANILENGWAVIGIASGALGIGAGVGRGARGMLKRRSDRRRDDLLIKQAIVGSPATEFSPREPGLIEMMTVLRSDFEHHIHTPHP